MAAKKYLSLVTGQWVEVQATQMTAGAADAGKLVALGDDGFIDDSMMPFVLGSIKGAWPVGSYLLPDNVMNMGSNTLPTTARLRFLPFVIPKRRQVTNIALWLVTAQSSAACHVGIYDDTEDGLPGDLISNDLTLDLSSGGGAKKESGTVTAAGGGSLYLEAGRRYWVGVGSKGIATNATITRVADADGKHIMGNFSNVGYPAHWRGYEASSYTYGALPGTAPSVSGIADSDIAVVGLKAA